MQLFSTYIKSKREHFLGHRVYCYTRISSHYKSAQLKTVVLDLKRFKDLKRFYIEDGQPLASCMAF